MRKILVLRGGALGDFIVTLPALSLLRERWPAAHIELAGNPTAAALAVERGLLDAVHSQHEARWSALFSDAPLTSAFATWLAEFDLVISYWPDADGELRRRFSVRDGQVFISAPAMPAVAPAAGHYCAPLRELGIPRTKVFYALTPDRRPAPRQTIAVHPGSGSPAKNWPLERWLDVIATLPQPVLLVLGEAERRSAPMLERMGAHVRVAQNLPLPALASELAQCRLFLGHDSGISHLAAACLVPSILLFGPTDPAMWAPPASHVTVLRRGPAVTSIAIDDVRQAVMHALRGPA